MFRTTRSLLCFITLTLIMVLGPFRPLGAVFDAPVRVEVVHSFAGGATDGAIPNASLMRAADGFFYGTTSQGGTANLGTVFRMTASGTVTVLHSFTGGAEGANPMSAVIQATDGNFYGTTYSGGGPGLGTVFRLTPSGTFTTLYAFTGVGGDGSRPLAALMQANNGNFFGTTQLGGSHGRGTLFEMTPAGNVIIRYWFTGGIDGAYPYSAVIQASDGFLYGTAYGADFTTFGRVYRMTLAGAVTVLHTFRGGADGANPIGPLVEASDGNFYGTTHFGGTSDAGTAFRMTPGGALTVLHSFGGADGSNPDSGVIQAADGNFYGTAKVGALGYGTIFKMTPAGVVTVLYTFKGGADGSVATAGLLESPNGKLYGTTNFGGQTSRGVVFRIPPTTVGDFDADGTTDVTVYRPSTGTWFSLRSSTNFSTFDVYNWGQPGDIPVPGDYDGDDITDVTVYRPSTGTWFVLKSSSNFTTFNVYNWGQGGDVPVPGDYDGDRTTDLTVYRPSTGAWFILKSSSNFAFSTIIDLSDTFDTPVSGDYDGDAKTDVTVYRPSTGIWTVWKSTTNYTTSSSYDLGEPGDVQVTGDYDGDGKTDVTIYRPSTGTWFVLKSTTSFTSFSVYQWGQNGDVAALQKP